MALNKYSHRSDKIADLYRAAFYLARGSKDMAMTFLRKSGENLKILNLRMRKKDSIGLRRYWIDI